MDFDELKRRIDHLPRMMLPENAASGCFTHVEILAREMNAMTARRRGER
jgi:hypothetical protein